MGLDNRNLKSKQQAFTLIELIMVIVLLGVMAVGVSGFLGLSSQTFVNISERDELLNSARFVVERLNRELRNAVPNSIRISNQAGATANNRTQCIEFVPIVASTFYTDIPVLPETKTVDIKAIRFVDQQNNPYQCSSSCSDVVTVYPLTTNDVYNVSSTATGKTFPLATYSPELGDEWTLKVIKPSGETGVLFNQESPTKRLYVANSAVSYCVSSGNINRYSGYGLQGTQSVPPSSGTTALMAENHSLLLDTGTNAVFNYQPANLKRNAVVQVNLSFERNQETITFNQQIHINNIP